MLDQDPLSTNLINNTSDAVLHRKRSIDSTNPIGSKNQQVSKKDFRHDMLSETANLRVLRLRNPWGKKEWNGNCYNSHSLLVQNNKL